MCGVCGFWAADLPTRDVARDRLTRMNDAIAHRGPDGSGVWHDPSTGVGLAHRRLAIVDLSESGRQPMTSVSGRYTLSFNGEVFNYEALRQELGKQGKAPSWRGHSDTEVMLAAFEAWGLERSLQHFIGMFALAVWDAEERSLSLVRDRLGIKPMYWSQTAEGLCFGSELKALRQFPGYQREIDRRAVSLYFERYCVPAPRSIYVGTSKLEAGTILTFTSAKSAATLRRFWSAADVARAGLSDPFRGSAADAVEALDALLRDSVRLRMVADVPLGAFLSGGVDSSTVVALMQAQSSRPVHTFSIENEVSSHDEGAAARAVAAHLGTNHTSLKVSAKDSQDVIPKLAEMYDEPFADSSQIPTFLVSQLARRDVTVALSGDGGDELFGGYNRHVWGPRVWDVQRRVPRPLRAAAARAMRSVSTATVDRVFEAGKAILPALRLPGAKLHKLASVLALSSPDDMHVALARHWQTDDGLLLDPVESQTPFDAPQTDDVALRMMFRDLVTYLPDDILTKVDRASMAVALEARVPLLDHRVVAFAWSLPLELKVHGSTGKWVLRQVLDRYVPKRLVSGPKMGFGIPVANWLRGPLRPWAEELLSADQLHSDGFFSVEVVQSKWQEFLAGKPWENQLWDVLTFQAWLRHHRAQ